LHLQLSSQGGALCDGAHAFANYRLYKALALLLQVGTLRALSI
jgi:hypothetical protein